MEKFRKNFLALLESKNYNIKQFAEKADLSYTTVRKFLVGESETTSINLIFGVLRVFPGTDLNQLFDTAARESENISLHVAGKKQTDLSTILEDIFHLKNRVSALENNLTIGNN